MASLKCDKDRDSHHLWTTEGVQYAGYCICVHCGEIGCVSTRLNEDWVKVKIKSQTRDGI